MTDYTGDGSAPVDDAVVDDPPTVDEVLAKQTENDRDAPGASVDDVESDEVVEPNEPA
jgi:hypothetical protein